MKVLELDYFRKIKAITKIEVQKQMSFRVNIFFHRLSNIVEIIIPIIIWTVIFQNHEMVSGYTLEEMMTYIIVGWLILFLIANYGLEDNVSRDIQEGTLSNFLVKPIDYIKYVIIFSFGRNIIAFGMGALTVCVLAFIMLDKIIIINSFAKLLVIASMIIGGFFVNLFVAILIGMIAFWTTAMSGSKYSIWILVSFLSGRFFPLDMLPVVYFKIILFFPFAYVYFIPLQLYLGKISLSQSWFYLGVEIFWLILLYGIIRLLYKKGLRKFEGIGI
ncbi:MAG: ABC transporter permease [Parcubacteria group bacterium Athens0714_25]|nr:MAG: ABC transporter permease [Parcubacteria group bacterium Athens0714_25]